MAWELCRAEGLAGLSLRDIARRIGMQAPSLYSYFDSKHAIYDAMFADGVREFVAQQPDAPTTDPVEGVKLRMRYYVAFCTADPVRYQLLFQRTIPGFEPSPESYALSVESLQALEAWLREAGLDAPGTLDLYTAIAAGLASQQNANEPGGDRWTRLIDEAAEMFVHQARVMKQRKATSGRRKK